MLKKSAQGLLLGGLLIALPAAAQDAGKGGGKGGTSVVPTVAGSGNVSAETLIQRYGSLAGSPANAASLVNGLRTGEEITLTDSAPPVPVPQPSSQQSGSQFGGLVVTQPQQQIIVPVPIKFTPPTGSMGWGNVDIALALTEALVKQQGHEKPTAANVRDALIATDGILQLRAKGMGWGAIAQSHGFALK
jgi:hypothetical protein